MSLARAVYQETDVYLLDDPLSAVDSHVSKHIFDLVLGPQGLLKDKARLLVTHALHLLPKCDNIILMDAGQVVDQGKYSELADGGRLQVLLEEYKMPDDEEGSGSGSDAGETTVDGETTTVDETTEVPVISAGTVSSTAGAGKMSKGGGGKVSGDKDGIESKGSKAGKGNDERSGLIQVEGAQEGSVDKAVYKTYFDAVGYWTIGGLTLLYVFAYAAQVGSSKWLDIWSTEQSNHDYAVEHNATHIPKQQSLGTYLGVYAALGIANSFGMLAISFLLAVGSIHAASKMHSGMLERVVRSPMSFFDTTPLGRVINRFSKDVYVVDETLPASFRSFMATFMQVVSILVVITMSTWQFLAVIIPVGFLYTYVQRFYVATSRQLKRLESVSRSPIYAHFGETLSGVASIRAYRKQGDFVDENMEKVDVNLQAYYPSICANRWLALRLEFVGNCIIFFAALFLVVESHSKNGINPGTVGLSLSYAMSVTQTLNWMVRMSSQLETDVVAVERIAEYSGNEVEAPPVTGYRPQRGWPQEGRVKFDGYSVRYREGLDLVVKNINIDIKGGEKVSEMLLSLPCVMSLWLVGV